MSKYGGKAKGRTKLRYFFYHDELHRHIHITRGDDLLIAWNYPQHKAVRLVYSDVRKNGGKAFKTTQVAEMVGRHPLTIKNMVGRGEVQAPSLTYGYLGKQEPYAYYWSEDDIMRLHDFLKTVHIGRPRKDGGINTRDLPTAAELRAMLRQGTVLYVKGENGEFVPSWQAPEI